MSEKTGNASGSISVIDFESHRAHRLEEKRRRSERIVFRKMLGLVCVHDKQQENALEIIDVSDSGIAFLVPYARKQEWQRKGTEVTLRLYLSPDSYLPVHAEVVYCKPYIDGGVEYLKVGCEVDPTATAFETYRSFVTFLKHYSLNAYFEETKASGFY